MKNHKYTISPLYDYFKYQERMGINVTPQNYLRYNLTEKLFEDYKFRVDNQMNVIVSIYGQTGSGKSAASMILAIILSLFHKIKWKFENMKDTSGDILLTIEKNNPPRGTVFIMDEQDVTRAGLNTHTMIQMLSDLEKRVRKKQWHFIYNSPIPLSHVHHFMLETDGIERKAGLIRLRIYDSIGILRGYVILPFPPKNIWDFYNNEFKKQIIDDISDFRSQEDKQIERILEELFDDPAYWAMDNNEQRSIYLLSKFPSTLRTKTSREQLVKITSPNSRKDFVAQQKSLCLSMMEAGEFDDETLELINRIRPTWYQK